MAHAGSIKYLEMVEDKLEQLEQFYLEQDSNKELRRGVTIALSEVKELHREQLRALQKRIDDAADRQTRRPPEQGVEEELDKLTEEVEAL